MEHKLPVSRRLPSLSGKVIAVIVSLAIIAAAAGTYAYRSAGTSATPVYQTVKVQKGNIVDAVTATGPIAASQAVPLNFKSSGKVASIDVHVGDRVTAGQVLAKLDTSDLGAQLNQAKANLSNVQAAYNKLVQGATPTALAAARASVGSANTQLADAQTSLGAAQAAAAKDVAAAQQTVANDQQAVSDANKNLAAVQAQVNASTAGDKVAVQNAQQALADAQRAQQSLPAVLAQQIQIAKDKLFADQTADDAAVARGQMTASQRQAALDGDQAAIDQANAQAVQQASQAQTATNQAQGGLNTANATLQNDLAKFQGTLVSAQTQVNAAQANLKSAQAALASTRAKDSQSVQSAQAQINAAAASLQTAQASYNQTAAPPTQADIAAARAQVAAQQAALQLAQNNMDAATLTAPSDGTVTAINGAVGQWLSGGATNGSAASSASGASATSSSSASSDFIDLTNLSGLQVTAQVNEADMAKVKIGDPANFTVDAYPGQTFTGKVAIIQPLGQNIQNVVSYPVTVGIDPAKVQLLPGMTASVSIVTAQAKNVLSVPMSALTYARTQAAGLAARGGRAGGRASGAGRATQGGGRPGAPGGAARTSASAGAAASGAASNFEQPGGPGILFVLKNGKPQPVRVRLGLTNGTVVEVASGLAAGDEVVTSASGAGAP
ncbi:MAG: efflux RND transporter periplasmic adaptor subunit, partial [Chloroflexota bacterium]